MGLINAIRTRGPLWATVHTSLWIFDKFIEFILYPIVIAKLGLVSGTAVMMILSLLICWTLIVLYDWLSNNVVRDALGFETVKEAGDEFQDWIATKWPFRNWNISAGSLVFKIATFLYLSLWHDPMTCTILMRPAWRHSMGKREWGLFLGSVFISNASWGLLVWTGVETIQQLFPVLWEKLA